MSSASKAQSGAKAPVQPAPPRHNTTAEPSPGDAAFPLIELRDEAGAPSVRIVRPLAGREGRKR